MDSTIFYQIILATVFNGSALFIISHWFTSRLENSIKHEYDRQLEDYKFIFRQKEETARLASLLALWGKYEGKEKSILSQKELCNYYAELTRMSYELSLWIRDEDLLKKIMKRLELDKEAPQPKELLVLSRKYILNIQDRNLTANDIVHWPVGLNIE